MLSSILAKTAINIIDVSAADSQGMEQHEYMDRARQYSTRLAMLSNNLTHWKKLPLLPSLTNQPHQVLASDPVPFADLQQHGRDGGAIPWWGGTHICLTPVTSSIMCHRTKRTRRQGMYDDPPLRGRRHLRFLNAHSQKECQKSGFANNQKVLLVNYTLGMEIEGYLFMGRFPQPEDGFIIFYAN
ncbi:ragulator complex protein LAMTOR1 isoform X3 [Vidua macroura]|nr:ragulator complex protein LAMTOR1 isoform X3 [Vidua chalybeata]XP_053824993.1 ragulator complex protein LAMTOR1 isoform X3 [Vidua chalybeata]XP_053828024.1 ragulator complex protein LAMTOR1 isoform X3 [Vidua macroura]XP_053828025.1 ragulator complex protein LAMTOR1 isoform X3 [Vidua macroura]